MSQHLVMDVAVADVRTELRAMMRDVEAADGVERILRRIGRRLASSAMLVDPSGATSPAGRTVPTALAADVRAVRDGRAGGSSVILGGRPICVLAAATVAPRPVLVVRGNVEGRRFGPAERELLADASLPLGLAWRERQVRLRTAQLDRVETRNREAVLSQLQAGNIAGARHTAAVLGPDLPDSVQIHIVQCPDGRVAETLRWCTAVAREWAWVVRCPVYRQHVVVIARADGDTVTDVLRRRAAGDPAYHVGSSEPLPLWECSKGYAHAFHALSVARHRPERHATFRGQGELSGILADAGSGWAERMLAPLLAYRPSRPQDPGSRELVDTLASWLSFHGVAARQLKVHRNTLTARLRLIGSLLGVDLGEVSTQARLNLALQLLGTPGDADVTLDELLARPDSRQWAERQRAPLRDTDPRLVATLRAWLDNRAQIGPTAAALGVSASGVRKRLSRIEQLMHRPLLDSPPTRYDLYLAFTA